VKVALISEWLDAWRGGAETSTLQFLHHLMDAGIEVHAYTRSRPSPTPGLVVHSVSGAAMARTRRSITFAHRVERMLRSERFDVVHAISPCRGADIYQPRGGTVAETIERNIALRPRPTTRSLKRYGNLFNLKQRYMLRMERELLGRPDGPIVVAISDYVVRQLKQHYGVADGRIRKIYNAVDPDAAGTETRQAHRRQIREEFGIGSDTLLVLTVAHNFRLKGVRHLLEALAMLGEGGTNDVRALVVGKDESGYWHRLAARLGVAGAVRFIGPSDRVPQLFHAGDILVHPTYYDPCSRVVLEAMTSGLVVITTRWDGAAEMIEHGVNGYILREPRDADAIASCMLQMLRDVQHRSRVQAEARRVTELVDMARHAREMLQLYRSLVPDRG